jgi:hypothetical protein
MAMPPPSSVQREEEIVAPESPGRGGVGFPAWSQLEEDEGATPALADMESEAQLLAEREQVRTRGDPSALQVAPEGIQERAMVIASRLSGPVSRSVAEWVWPDPDKPGEARFVLRVHREEKLWGLLEWSKQSAYGELAIIESGLVEALNKVRVTWWTASGELLSFAWVSLNGSFLVSILFMVGNLSGHF